MTSNLACEGAIMHCRMHQNATSLTPRIPPSWWGPPPSAGGGPISTSNLACKQDQKVQNTPHHKLLPPYIYGVELRLQGMCKRWWNTPTRNPLLAYTEDTAKMVRSAVRRRWPHKCIEFGLQGKPQGTLQNASPPQIQTRRHPPSHPYIDGIELCL